MTFREKLKQVQPAKVGGKFIGGCYGCPVTFGFEADVPEHCRGNCEISKLLCGDCWDREVPEKGGKE